MEKWLRLQYQPNLPLGKSGKRVTGCKEHIKLSRKAATEGMILLKNDNSTLPLNKEDTVALFGIASADYVKGGGGSGDVYTAYCRNLCDAIEIKANQGKISVFDELSRFYISEAEKQYSNGTEVGKTTEPIIPDDLLNKSKNVADTAIISICRYSAENSDRTNDDFYLTNEEKNMISKVLGNFKKTVVVLNVGGMVDTSWFKNNDKVGAVLLGWQAGMEGGLAEADILCGDVCPSGKLTDTFASSFDDYPSSEGFDESDTYVEYTDDIYVGYRYFETIPGADNKVNYPFGYGLSYTDFDIKTITSSKKGNIVTLEISVENTGNYIGKEVVQVYYSAPDGLLGKPKKQLIAFKKTKALKPLEKEIFKIKINIKDMASFDDLGVIQKSAFLLEKGKYGIMVGNSVRNTDAVFEFQLDENIIVEQLSSLGGPKKLSKRLLSNGTYQELPMSEYDVDNTDFSNWPKKPTWDYEPIRFDTADTNNTDGLEYGLQKVANGKETLDELMSTFSDDDLIELVGGKPNRGVSNTRGFGDIYKYRIPTVMTADGPAGLRLNYGINIATTAWPCATLLACTFNVDLVKKVGECGAKEVKENNLGVWLTPGMNIHRSPLCGRNFEYYSEDPYVAGKIASAMIKGIQSQNISATPKHFCCNNKETNRFESDSRVSERALREVYLKGFEIAVKEANPWTLMTSYNIINGKYASENKELISILRNEWKFDGLITSDWDNHAEHYRELLAGNNIRMPYCSGKRLKKALELGLISRNNLYENAKKVLELILKLD